jgi:sulfite reductase alpha subunit-like flavoprotein
VQLKGVSVLLQPVLDEAALLQLGPAKYKVTYLARPAQSLALHQQQQPQGPAGNVHSNQAGAETCQAHQQQEQEQELIDQAVAAAAAFRKVAAEAAGMGNPNYAASPAVSAAGGGATYGPWQPFMAPLLINKRVTSANHFQDTRHIEFDISGSGQEQYQPGDLLAVFPRTPAGDVEVNQTTGRLSTLCPFCAT